MGNGQGFGRLLSEYFSKQPRRDDSPRGAVGYKARRCKMRQPDIYMADVIKRWDVDKELPGGTWVPARPYGHNAFSWRWRFKLAWGVFTGKFDVLNWE